MVVDQHQHERLRLESGQDLRHIMEVSAVNPADGRAGFRSKPPGQFPFGVRIAVADRPFQIHEAYGKVPTPQVSQEAFRFIDTRKIGNQDLSFHPSKISIFCESPFFLPRKSCFSL